MQQEALTHPKNGVSHLSFHQKSSALSLIISSSATAYYFVNMWPLRPIALENNVIPAGYGTLLLSTAALVIIAQIVLHIVLAVATGTVPTATVPEKTAVLQATRNAYTILTIGLFAAIGSVFLTELTPFCTANLAILSFALAEIVKYVSQLLYGRK